MYGWLVTSNSSDMDWQVGCTITASGRVAMSASMCLLRDRGFTLVELMVALLISTVLLGAIYENYLATQRSYRFLEGLSQLQENARFSMYMLGSNIRSAGFRANTEVSEQASFPVAGVAAPSVASFGTAGQVVTGSNNDAGVAAILDGSDTVSVRYQGNNDGTTRDCLGAVVAAGVIAVNTFYVDTANELQCNNGTNDFPLADGVENMQVLYGLDTDGDEAADVYRNAAGIAGDAWLNVVSVRVAMLFTSVNASPGMGSSGRSFTLLDNAPQTFNDTLRRQIFVTTINLRNRTL